MNKGTLQERFTFELDNGIQGHNIIMDGVGAIYVSQSTSLQTNVQLIFVS